MMFAAMVVFAGVVGALLLFCTRGGRRFVGVGVLLTLAFLLSTGIYLFRSEAHNVRARRAALEAEQRTVADRLRAEIEARLGGDALRKKAKQRRETVTVEIRWHADRFEGLASSPTAIAEAVTSILVALDEMTSNQSEFADGSLKHLLDTAVPIDDGRTVRLGELAQVVALRRVGAAENSEGTVHVRLEGVDPHQVATLLDQATSLVERAMASADDTLQSLASIDRDDDARGFVIRFPALDARQVASRLILPANLDAPATKAAEVPNTETADDSAEIRPVAAEEALKPEVAVPQEPALPLAPEVAPAAAASADVARVQGERPDWVDQGEVRLPNGIYRMTSRSGPYSSTEECFAEAPGMVHGMVTRYVGRLFGREAQEQLKVPGSWIESVLVKDQWIGEVESEALGTTMYEMHVLVEFDDAARRELAAMWHKERLDRRLAMTGTASGLVLLLLGTTFGYLKLDTATRGFYSGRLKLVAGAIVAGAGVVLVQLLRMV